MVIVVFVVVFVFVFFNFKYLLLSSVAQLFRLILRWKQENCKQAYSESSQTSKMELFAQRFILDVRLGSEYATARSFFHGSSRPEFSSRPFSPSYHELFMLQVSLSTNFMRMTCYISKKNSWKLLAKQRQNVFNFSRNISFVNEWLTIAIMCKCSKSLMS